MKSQLWRAAILVGIAGFLVASSARGEGVTLRYKFKEGQVLNVKNVEKSKVEAMGVEMTTNQERYFESTVQKVEDGNATIAMKMTRVVFKSSNPMSGDVDFDSDKDEEVEAAQAKILKLMVGKSFTVKIDPKGKILDLQGMTKIAEEIVKTIKEEAEGDPMAEAQADQLGKQLNDEAVKTQMQSSFLVMPEEAVEVGYEWKTDTNEALPMLKVKSSSSSKVESIEGNIVKITTTGKIEGPAEEEGGDEENPMAKMMKISDGSMSGSIEFDNELGMVKKVSQTLKIKMTSPMGEMPVEVTTVQELLDKAPEKKADEGEGEEEGDEEEEEE